MQFSNSLIQARLIKRYKRFLADAELENGEIITAHCANPGAMLGVNMPGSKIWLSKHDDPKRKLKYSWELIEIETDKTPSIVGINTSHPNKLVEEAIRDGTIKELDGYEHMHREVKYGQNSRIDILLQDDNRPDCYVEVKNVHLMRTPGIAEFPDSVTSRGAKHLKELSEMAKEKKRAVMIFLIQRSDADKMMIARDIDPTYGLALDEARKQGVELLAYGCKLTPSAIEVTEPVLFCG